MFDYSSLIGNYFCTDPEIARHEPQLSVGSFSAMPSGCKLCQMPRLKSGIPTGMLPVATDL
jgi:hypothetical protein